jgi:hypothetical protein
MPIYAAWQDEKQAVVRNQFIGHWTMKHFRAAWARNHELMRQQGGRRVDFILDLRESILIPPDFVRQFRQMPFDKTQNFGLLVFVGADDHMQILIRTLLQSLSYALVIEFADTPEDALTIVSSARCETMALSA